MNKCAVVVILAAGEGTRMKSAKAKVMHKVCGYPIIEHVVRTAEEISESLPVVVVGHRAEQIEQYLGQRVRYAYQAQRLGTGHAVMVARPVLEKTDGYVVVVAGDIPLIRSCTLQKMVRFAYEGRYDAVALSAILEDPTGYGRIIRDDAGDLERIVEHKDATDEQRQVKEINVSAYCFNIRALLASLDGLDNHNTQGEYYLTDVIHIMKERGNRVGAFVTWDADEVLGINTRVQLAEVEQKMRQRINRRHMENGVTLIDPNNTYIEPDVVIGCDTIIYPGNVLEGRTVIGEECILYPNSRIVNSLGLEYHPSSGTGPPYLRARWPDLDGYGSG